VRGSRIFLSPLIMQRILITGASGNVGQAILRHMELQADQELWLGSRKLPPPGENQLFFDFEQLEASERSLQQVDILFLLRPPHISDVKAYFQPLIAAAERAGVEQVIFLSVQGADKVSFIPHAKIEKLLRESSLTWTFIRPSYFMQNLTTTLLPGIRDRKRIFLPAGKAPFLWVDVDDIGRAIAAILKEPAAHRGQAYDITGQELINFEAVAKKLSVALEIPIRYESPSLLRFFVEKKRQQTPTAFILVMIMLHYLPRFQPPPQVSDALVQLTGTVGRRLDAFIQNHKALWKK
jgi:uncharacterized protein YbjT (DUF2867 family)